jgi:hypothetical protein
MNKQNVFLPGGSWIRALSPDVTTLVPSNPLSMSTELACETYVTNKNNSLIISIPIDAAKNFTQGRRRQDGIWDVYMATFDMTTKGGNFQRDKNWPAGFLRLQSS